MEDSQLTLIGTLKKAQAIDKEIYDLTEIVEDVPGHVAGLKVKFDAKRVALDQLMQELKAIQVRQKELENDLASKESSIKKMDAQLGQVKTNKEYAALQQEMQGVKADISMIEEKILLILDEAEKQKARVDEEKKYLAREEEKFKQEKAAVECKGKEAQARVSGLIEERKKILTDVDTNVVSTYEAILKNRDGLALSPLEGESCGVCQMLIRPQVQNEVKMSARLVTCESCGRILYTP